MKLFECFTYAVVNNSKQKVSVYGVGESVHDVIHIFNDIMRQGGKIRIIEDETELESTTINQTSPTNRTITLKQLFDECCT